MGRNDGIGYCGKCGRRATWVTLDGYGGCEIHGRGPLDWTRPLPTADVRDAEGNRVARGQRVVDAYGREVGTVVEVTEPDADYDDRAGRAVQTGPVVVVEYDDGTVERWLAHEEDPEAEDGIYVAEDVLVEERS